jgi:hypothetical protein
VPLADGAGGGPVAWDDRGADRGCCNRPRLSPGQVYVPSIHPHTERLRGIQASECTVQCIHKDWDATQTHPAAPRVGKGISIQAHVFIHVWMCACPAWRVCVCVCVRVCVCVCVCADPPPSLLVSSYPDGSDLSASVSSIRQAFSRFRVPGQATSCVPSNFACCIVPPCSSHARMHWHACVSVFAYACLRMLGGDAQVHVHILCV